MCGIGGIFVAQGVSMPVDEVKALWTLLEDRGTHAAGVSWAWENADEPVVFKAPRSSSTMTDKIDMVSGSNSIYAFFHTRYTTQGSTSNNGNNHPVVSNDFIVTHNGVLRNDSWVFRFTNQPKSHQVDTEAINAGLRYGGIGWVADNIQGSMSIAWVDITQNHEEVNLFTNGGNPLVIARVNGGQVVWASTLEHIEEAGFEIESSFNASPYKHYTISRDDSGEVLIDSYYCSDKFAEAQVSGMYRHSSSYARNVGYTTKTPKKSKKARKSPKTSRNEQGQIVWGGMTYDPVSQTWRMGV